MGKPKHVKGQGKRRQRAAHADHVSTVVSQPWREHLAIAVPLRQIALFSRGGLTRADLIEAHIHMEGIGATFDHALSQAAQEGEVANLMNRVTTAVAALSYMPGGIEVWNQRFDAVTFLAGLVGEQEAQTHVQSSLQHCFGEVPPSQEALESLLRERVDEMLAKVKRARRW